MTSVFPDALDNLAADKANATASSSDHPDHHNELAAAVNAVETVVRTGYMLNVKHFGAVGDGVTDDTTAIIAAIAAASAAGGQPVYFPVGTYITTMLTIPAGIPIVGDNRWRSVIKLKASTNTALITLTGDFGMFQNIGLDGNKANNPTVGHGITGLGIGSVTMKGIRVVNCDRGIFLSTTGGGSYSHNIIIEDADIEFNKTMGLSCNVDSRFSHCYVGNNGIDNAANQYACNVYVDAEGVDFEGHIWASGKNGVYMHYASGNNFHDTIIEESQRHGVFYDGRGNNNRFRGCQFVDNGKLLTNTYDHIHYYGAPAGETMEANMVEGCRFIKRASTATNARYCISENNGEAGGVAPNYNLYALNTFRGGYGTGVTGVSLLGANNVTVDNIA